MALNFSAAVRKKATVKLAGRLFCLVVVLVGRAAYLAYA